MIQFAEVCPYNGDCRITATKIGWTQFLRLIRSDDRRKHNYGTVNVWRKERGAERRTNPIAGGLAVHSSQA